jgi:hypothetical protein
MGHLQICLLLATAGLGQAPAGQDEYYTSAIGAARELSRSLDFLQRSFATIPTDPPGRGLYKQLDPIQLDQLYFSQQLDRRASRSDLYLAYAKVDTGLSQLFADIQDISKWDAALRMAMRRVRSAQHDVHAALSAGDQAPDRQGQGAYRQVLALDTRAEDLDNLARYVFNEQDSQPGWKADFANLRSAISSLQRGLKDGTPDAARRLMLQVDQAWSKLIDRYNDLPRGQHLLLRSDFIQFDRMLARLAPLVGVTDRRPALKEDSY